MERTAAAALSQHSHTWGPIQHDDPPAYLVSAHGPGAFAGADRRYRACTGRRCGERVFGADVEHADVLANLDAAHRASHSLDRFPLDTIAPPRLTTAGTSA